MTHSEIVEIIGGRENAILYKQVEKIVDDDGYIVRKYRRPDENRFEIQYIFKPGRLTLRSSTDWKLVIL